MLVTNHRFWNTRIERHIKVNVTSVKQWLVANRQLLDERMHPERLMIHAQQTLADTLKVQHVCSSIKWTIIDFKDEKSFEKQAVSKTS